MATLLLFNKPYQVLSQFTDNNSVSANISDEKRKTLAYYINKKGVYPAGRLDYDSEGLLLLTDSGEIQHHISHPKHKLPKTYWVQVEGEPSDEAYEKLALGVKLKDGKTKPAKVSLIDAPLIWEREPPIRYRESIPTHWLQIIITEGRNRQVRRMTAAVGLPTLRLIRYAIGQWTIDNLRPGEWNEQSLHMPKATTIQQKSRSSHKKRNK